jgi:carbon monoxide dehydrogenase subunit G
MRRAAGSAVVAACVLALAPAAPPARADDVAVHVDRRGGRIVIDVEGTLPGPADTVWAVLTDYEHMGRFMTAVKASAVRRLDDGRLEVAQTFETQVGPFRFRAGSVRAVALRPPLEMHATLVGGDFEAYESSTRLTDHGASTGLSAHTEFVPKAWIPPLIGPATIASETRRQYRQLAAEVARRAPAAASAVAR